jgi:hypothetical protein
MSEQGTADIADRMRLEQDLRAGAKAKSVQLVNNPPTPAHWPVGYIEADPNHTADSHPHKDVVREKLRAGAKEEKASPQDRAAAAEALRVMYRE